MNAIAAAQKRADQERAKAEKAAEAAARAESEAEQALLEAEKLRLERASEYDRQELATYDPEEHRQREVVARERAQLAFLSSDWGAALLEWRRLHYENRMLAGDMNNVARDLGEDPIAVPEWRELDVPRFLVDALEHEAQRLANEVIVERDERRERFVSGGEAT